MTWQASVLYVVDGIDMASIIELALPGRTLAADDEAVRLRLVAMHVHHLGPRQKPLETSGGWHSLGALTQETRVGE